MKTITKEELNTIITLHVKWLYHESDGVKADLSNAYLSYADLSYANLSDANLSYADLHHADLHHADLSYADLSHADFSDANLSYANLHHADVSGANLYKSCFNNVNLADIKCNLDTCFFNLQCPEEGSFIGYKKCDDYIVKLLIPNDALRSSSTSYKCRCNKAKVLSITNLDGSNTDIVAIPSDYNCAFIYKIGEIVSVNDFDTNRWNECSTGIHFFMNLRDAINY